MWTHVRWINHLALASVFGLAHFAHTLEKPKIRQSSKKFNIYHRMPRRSDKTPDSRQKTSSNSIFGLTAAEMTSSYGCAAKSSFYRANRSTMKMNMDSTLQTETFALKGHSIGF